MIRVTKYIILLMVIFLTYGIANAQDKNNREGFYVGYNFLKDPITKGKNDIIIAYNGSDNNYGEIGYMRGYRGNEGWGYVYSGYSLSSEFILSSDNFSKIIGPKIGYSTTLAFLNMGGYVINYINLSNGKSQICFRPEIGLSFFGLATLFYGYNLNNEVESKINSNVMGLKFVLGKGSAL